MNVLVTGGCGYIGSHTVRALKENGFGVVVIDNLTTGSKIAIPNDIPLVVGSLDKLTVANTLKQFEVSAVMHFAASTSVPESVSHPEWYYRNNVAETLSLLEAVIASKLKYFIFSSTAAVYGTPDSSAVDETHATLPQSPYGTSKLMCESMLKDISKSSGLNYMILRYFNVGGAHPSGELGQRNPKASHLILSAIRAALDCERQLTIHGDDYPTPDGTGVRDYLHVSDLADAHVLALKALVNGEDSQTLNCGYGRGCSVLDVIRSVERVGQTELRVVKGPRRSGDVATCVAKAEKIKKVLGWDPQYLQLDDIVRHSLLWEKKLNHSTQPMPLDGPDEKNSRLHH